MSFEYMDFEYEIKDDNQIIITKCNRRKRKVVIPAVIDGYKVSHIKEDCFLGSQAIEEIEIPEGIKSIGEFCFAGCRKLKKIKLPKDLLCLENCCFGGTGLEKIEIPEGVKNIGEFCFRGCEKLKRIKLPKSLCNLGTSCFSDCPELREIEGADRFDLYMAFWGCDKYKASFPYIAGFPYI